MVMVNRVCHDLYTYLKYLSGPYDFTVTDKYSSAHISGSKIISEFQPFTLSTGLQNYHVKKLLVYDHGCACGQTDTRTSRKQNPPPRRRSINNNNTDNAFHRNYSTLTGVVLDRIFIFVVSDPSILPIWPLLIAL